MLKRRVFVIQVRPTVQLVKDDSKKVDVFGPEDMASLVAIPQDWTYRLVGTGTGGYFGRATGSDVKACPMIYDNREYPASRSYEPIVQAKKDYFYNDWYTVMKNRPDDLQPTRGHWQDVYKTYSYKEALEKIKIPAALIGSPNTRIIEVIETSTIITPNV